MTAALYLVEEPDDRPTTAEALEAVLATDDGLWETLEGACRAGLAELRDSVLGFRAALLAGRHNFDSHDRQFEETFAALLGLAEEYLPDSFGAARGRLRERARESVRPRPDRGVKMAGSVDCRQAVEIALAFEDAFFDEAILAAGSEHARLYAAARRVRGALAKTGREYPVEEVENTLWVLVREIAPDSPAARPDTARLEEMWARAQDYVERNDPGGNLGDEQRQEHEVRALHAVRDHDPPRYRAALRELCRAARDASRATNGNGGGGDEG